MVWAATRHNDDWHTLTALTLLPYQWQMLVSLLLTTMASSNQDGAQEFAHSACRHFALLLASGWGARPAPALPPTSKYASYPVLDGMPASVTALKHLHPCAILEAFEEVRLGSLGTIWCSVRALPRQSRPSKIHVSKSSCFLRPQGFALKNTKERDAVLGCMSAFLGALKVVTTAQSSAPPQASSQPGNDTLLAGLDTPAAASSTGDRWRIATGHRFGSSPLAVLLICLPASL